MVQFADKLLAFSSLMKILQSSVKKMGGAVLFGLLSARIDLCTHVTHGDCARSPIWWSIGLCVNDMTLPTSMALPTSIFQDILMMMSGELGQ